MGVPGTKLSGGAVIIPEFEDPHDHAVNDQLLRGTSCILLLENGSSSLNAPDSWGDRVCEAPHQVNLPAIPLLLYNPATGCCAIKYRLTPQIADRNKYGLKRVPPLEWPCPERDELFSMSRKRSRNGVFFGIGLKFINRFQLLTSLQHLIFLRRGFICQSIWCKIMPGQQIISSTLQ